MNKLLCIVLLACVLCQSMGQVLPITFYDQAPACMTHSRFPSGYWDVYYFYDYPLNGTSGTANNTFGFSSSDFEVPLFMLQGFTNYSKNNDKAPIIEGETGLVGARCSKADGSENCGRLGPDGTPSYAYTGRSPLGSVSSPTTFYDFFHSTARTSVVPGNITLTTDSNDSSLKSFNSFSYFPLDGLGWSDTFSYYDSSGTVQQHNFAWCFTAHTGFTYRGDEFFDFLGHDDFFVYINGYLVIDLGGVHTASNASVNVNSLGLTVGSNYTFDMFYCNRHTADSALKFSTNIVFACPQGTSCTTVPTPVPITTTVPTTATPTTKPATTVAPSTGPATSAAPTSKVPTTNSVTTTAPTTRSATTVLPTTKSAVTTVPTTPVLTTSAPTMAPSTPVVTTGAPTTATVTTSAPTTAVLTTAAPKTLVPPTTPTPITTVSTTAAPTTAVPTPVTTSSPTTASPTTSAATTTIPTTIAPSTASPTTSAATTIVPTTVIPSTFAPTTIVTTTASVTTAQPTSSVVTTTVPTSITPTAVVTTSAPTATHVIPTSTPTTSRPVVSASVCVTVSMVTAVASIAVILGF